jgi:hypothetical protein
MLGKSNMEMIVPQHRIENKDEKRYIVSNAKGTNQRTV